MSDGNSDLDRVWKLMDRIGFCMLATREGDDIRSRPMAAHVVRDENAVYFLTDVDSHKDDEIEAEPNVGLAFAIQAARNMFPSAVWRRFRTTAPRSGSCGRPRPRPGGTVPMILRSACLR